MNIRRRSLRLVRAFVALLLVAVFGPAKGIGFDLNHYILGCGDVCPYFSGPVAVVGGSAIDATFTGSWYDPAQSGHGIFIEVLPNQRIAAYWFTFSPDGTRQAWLAGSGTYIRNVATFDSVTMPTGGRWIPNFDATKVVDNPWGTMTLTFDDANNGKVEFASTSEFGAGSMKLARLTAPTRIAAATASATSQWIPGGSLLEPRDSPTLVTLANGKVLAIGGGNYGYAIANTAVTRGVELYDPSTRSWVVAKPLPVQRRDHTATLLQDGQVLVVGGWDDTDKMPSTADRYDPVTNTWTTEPGPARGDHTATLLKSGKVLVVGGIGFSGGEAKAQGATLYDPVTHTWSDTGPMRYPRSQLHRATLLADGRVLVTGTRQDVGGTWWFDQGLETEIYDPVANTWSVSSPLAPAHALHTATLLLDGRVLVTSANSVSAIFDPASGQWAVTGSLHVTRANHAASLLPNGKVLVTGGISFSDGQLVDSTELYDPAAGLWMESTPLLTPRAQHAATVLASGDVLTVGGYGPQQDAQGHNMLLGTSEIYSAAFPPGTIVPGYSGAWFDPAQKGHGILVEVLPGAQVLAWWFAFNPAGTEQAWFGGLGGYSGNTATVAAVDQPTGGRFIPNFDPSKIVHNPWGLLTLTFTDCDHGKVDFASTAGYGSGSMNLTRLTRPAGLVCP